MAVAPSEIFQRAATEGKRRLDQSLVELLSTSFIAGFTIVFGIVGLGVAHALVEPQLGSIAKLSGALVFGIGLVFLIVGRAELFTENFFDPVATAFDRREIKIVSSILRLWLLTFVLNLIGGGLFALVFWHHGVLPPGADAALSKMAEEIVARGTWAALMSAIVGGALVALLSFMLAGADSVASRIIITYFVGFLLALGPFDHVVVTTLQLFFGILFGAPIGFGDLATVMGIVTAGNLVGGVGLVTFSHVAQAKAA
jgi:formate/nitrite transporter FocA (FNT family)